MGRPARPRTAGIYAITHVATGRQYIGQSQDVDGRWLQHQRDLNNNKARSRYLQHAWNKYGPDAFAFSVLEAVADLAQLDERERWWLRQRFAARGSKEFNMSPEGGGSNRGVRWTDESRRRQSERVKGTTRAPLSAETRARIGEANRMANAGKPWSPKRRAAQPHRSGETLTPRQQAAYKWRKLRPRTERELAADQKKREQPMTEARMASVRKAAAAFKAKCAARRATLALDQAPTA